MDLSLFSNSEIVAAAHIIADGLYDVGVGIAIAGLFIGMLSK